MANETIMQGLLESLMQRPQDTAQQKGTVLANLISQPNPLAATVAYMMPGQLENVAGAARGLFGLKAPVTPQMQIQEAQQAVAANPQLLADPTWLTQKAQELSAVDPSLGMRFAAGAVSAQSTQASKATLEARRKALLEQVDAVSAGATAPAAKNALGGLRKAVEAGAYDDKDITAPLENIIQVTKAPEPEQTGMKPNDIAQLYKDYTPDSVQKFITDPSAVLVPREQGGGTSSNYARQLQEAGMVPGSLEFKQAMADYNKSMVQGNLRQLSTVEQVNLMNDQLNKLPTVEQTSNNLAQLSQVKSILPLAGLGKSNPQAYTLLTAVLPQLVGSNSRAQAEIDAFRSRKSINESLGDWLTLSLGGTATKETLDNLNEIVNILDRNFTAQRLREVSSVAAGYKGVVPDDVLANWQRNQLSDLDTDIENIVNNALGL